MIVNAFERYSDDMTIAQITELIQNAIDSVADHGGGAVRVQAKPGEYVVNGLRLRSNITFEVCEGITLKSSGDENTFVQRPGPFEFKAAHTPICAFIHTEGCHDVTICGEGAIDGNYRLFIPEEQEDPTHLSFFKYPRPMLCYFEDCRNVRIEGITLKNTPFWTVHLVGCRDTTVSGVTIDNDMAMPNTDGIDIDRCSNTLIENCHISGGDDGVCLKCTEETERYGNCVNVHVRNCEIHSTSAAIKFGSSSFADFENCLFEDLTIRKTNRALGLQLRDGGSVRNIVFKNISLATKDAGPRWWGAGEPIYITLIPRTDSGDVSKGMIENLVFENVSGDVENGIIVYAQHPEQVRNIAMRNVRLTIHHDVTKPLAFDMRPCPEYKRDHLVDCGIYLKTNIETNGTSVLCQNVTTSIVR